MTQILERLVPAFWKTLSKSQHFRWIPRFRKRIRRAKHRRRSILGQLRQHKTQKRKPRQETGREKFARIEQVNKHHIPDRWKQPPSVRNRVELWPSDQGRHRSERRHEGESDRSTNSLHRSISNRRGPRKTSRRRQDVRRPHRRRLILIKEGKAYNISQTDECIPKLTSYQKESDTSFCFVNMRQATAMIM